MPVFDFHLRLLALAMLCQSMILLPSGGAAGQEEEAEANRLPIVLTGCDAELLDGLNRILDIEMAALSEETSVWLDAHNPSVRIVCGDENVNIEIKEPYTGKFSGQTLDYPDDVQRELTRFVALTVVELIASRAASAAAVSQVEKAAPSPPVVPAPPPTSPPEASPPPEPREALPTLRLGGLFLLHGGYRPFMLSVGGGISLEIDVMTYLALAADVAFFSGKTTVDDGEIRANTVTGALFVLGRVPLRSASIKPGAGFRAGSGIFNGTPADSDSTDGDVAVHLLGGPCLAVHGDVLIGRRLFLPIRIEVGYAIWRAGAKVDDRIAVSFEGVWFMAGIGIGGGLK